MIHEQVSKREDDERHSPFGGCPMDASEAHVNVYLFSSENFMVLFF